MYSSLAAGASEFSRHVWQTEELVAATTVEYSPARQLSHKALPVEFLYLPATHCRHRLPLSPVYPALKVQSVCLLLADGASKHSEHNVHTALALAAIVIEKVPCPHATHDALPGRILYFPATHAVQCPPSLPV